MTILDQKFEQNQSKVVLTPSGSLVQMMSFPKQNLYVVTDSGSFGGNWIRVLYRNTVFDCQMLLGYDPNGYICAMARFFAASLVRRRLEFLDRRVDPTGMEMQMLFNIALCRDTLHESNHMEVVRYLGKEFEKFFTDD